MDCRLQQRVIVELFHVVVFDAFNDCCERARILPRYRRRSGRRLVRKHPARHAEAQPDAQADRQIGKIAGFR